MSFTRDIETLAPGHERSGFACGAAALDTYLKKQSSQDVKKKAAIIYVQLEDDGKTIAGYYTLASTSIHVGVLPPDQARLLPKYPLIPAILIGRLARDLKHRREGLGERLLVDALCRSYAHSTKVAAAVVVVDAKDDSAAAFYKRYSFLSLPDQPHRLFLMMSTIDQLYM